MRNDEWSFLEMSKTRDPLSGTARWDGLLDSHLGGVDAALLSGPLRQNYNSCI